MPTHASSNHHPRISPPGPTARNFEFEIIFSTTTTSDGDDERRARASSWRAVDDERLRDDRYRRAFARAMSRTARVTVVTKRARRRRRDAAAAGRRGRAGDTPARALDRTRRPRMGRRRRRPRARSRTGRSGDRRGRAPRVDGRPRRCAFEILKFRETTRRRRGGTGGLGGDDARVDRSSERVID